MWEGQGSQILSYWDLNYPRRDSALPARSPEEHADQLRDALDEAVRLRLQADVPVGCYLSGGLDSSMILSLAARHATTPIDAFTVAFDNEAYDESALAAETARYVGARHHVLTVTEDQLADHFAETVWHSETINPNTNGVAKYLLSRTVRQAGPRVVLTGEGADEVAAGYEFLVRDMLIQGRRGAAVRRVRGLGDLSGPGIPSGEGGVSAAHMRERLGFVPSWVCWFAEAAAHSRTFWSPGLRDAVEGLDPYRDCLGALDVPGQLEGREAVHQSLYLWTKTVFANLLLNQLGDRMEMAHGIEGRLPFLDGPVVDLLREMPVSVKIRGNHGKHVVRMAARHCLPDAVLRRRKKAFLAPPPSLSLDGRLHQMIQDLLRSATMAAVPFFDHCAVLRFLDDLQRLGERAPHAATGIGNQLVYMASACVLQDRFAPSG
jgi:asparagine synthase (glutamine-hydrolysing)